MSDDIDLFTDEPYNTVDFDGIDRLLRKKFRYVSDLQPGPIGMGVSYLVGDSSQDAVKIDLYYTTDSFIQDFVQYEIYRLATIEEILAMKIDIVQRKARKKDFWDLHELLDTYSIQEMIALHAKRYPHSHDATHIFENFTDFSQADNDFDPICLRGKHWELIKLDFLKRLEID